LKLYIIRPLNTNTVYWAHNGGRFDSLFILKALLMLGFKDDDLELINNKGVWLSIKVHFKSTSGKTKYWVEFRDSYQLLPCSLKDLCTSFKISDILGMDKGSMDHALISKLNYIKNLKLIYHHVTSDVKVLSHILSIFRDRYFKDYNLDPLKCLTLSQLTFKCFRKNFYEVKDKPNITSPKNSLREFISEAYYGGTCEVYIPYGKFGYFYDFISFYPYLCTLYYPGGHPRSYDVSKGLDNLFGYARVTVHVPYTARPTLPRRTQQGTVVGYGT
jgi:hypothetical protein